MRIQSTAQKTPEGLGDVPGRRRLDATQAPSLQRATTVAADDRGNIALGTDDGTIVLMREPRRTRSTAALNVLLYGDAQSDPTFAYEHPPPEPRSAIVDLDVVATPSDGVLVAASTEDGRLLAIAAQDGGPTFEATIPGPSRVDARLTEAGLLVAFAGDLFAGTWWPESGDPPELHELPSRAASVTIVSDEGHVAVAHDAGVRVLPSELELGDGSPSTGVTSWRWPDGTNYVAATIGGDQPHVLIRSFDPATSTPGPERRHEVEAAVVGLTHTRDLLGVLLADGSIDILSLGSTGRQRLPGDGTVRPTALMRLTDGRPAVVSVIPGEPPVFQPISLSRQPGDDLLTLNNDRPSNEEPDLLDFGAYARPLSLVVAAEATDTPLVIGIDGQWGQGKTRLGRMVDASLPHVASRGDVECRSVWFNAWLHSDAEDLATALAAAVSVGIHPLRPWWRRLVSPAPGRAMTRLRRYGRIVGTLVAVLAGMALLLQPDWLDRVYESTGTEAGSAIFSLGGITVTIGLLRFVSLVRDRVGGVLDGFIAGVTSTAESGRMTDVRDDLGRRIHQATRPIPDPGSPSPILGLDGIREWSMRAGRFGPLRRAVAQLFAVRGERRIVLFVDDLDRCQASHSIGVCETIAQLLDHPRMVTIVMVDVQSLAAHAEVEFKDLAKRLNPNADGAGWGRRFLDKIFQFEFTIPTHRPDALSTLLRSSLDDRAPLPFGAPKREEEVEADDDAPQGLAAIGPPARAPDPTFSGADTPLLGGPVGSLGEFGALGSWNAGTSSLWSSPSSTSTSWMREGEWGQWATLVLCVVAFYFADQVDPWWAKALIFGGAVVIALVTVWRQTQHQIDRDRLKIDEKYSSLFDDPPKTLGSLASHRISAPDSMSSFVSSPGAGWPTVGSATGSTPSSTAALALARRQEIKVVLQEGDHLDLGFNEARRWLHGTTPRTAKRLANRLLFTTAVAMERGLLWTDSALDGRVIGKWVTLVERWPAIAEKLRGDQDLIQRLEAAADRPAAFAKIVASCHPNVADVEVLRELIKADPTLGRHAAAFAYLAH